MHRAAICPDIMSGHPDASIDMPTTLILAYLMFSLINALVPGPNLLFVLRTSVVGGRSGAHAAAAGLCVPMVIWGMLAASGTAALFARMPLAFAALKVAGAAYIFWLGWQLLHRAGRAAAREGSAGADGVHGSNARYFGQGFLTSILNPNIFLFFLAVFPQFLSGATMSINNAAVLVGLFVAVNALWYTLVTRLFELLRERATSDVTARWTARVIGVSMMGFGILFLTRI